MSAADHDDHVADPAMASAVLHAMRTTGSLRHFATRDVSDDVIDAAVEAARFGPSGGNRQPVRWIAVRDREVLAALAALYLPLWKRDMAMFLNGQMRTGATLGPAVQAADHFAEHFAEVPVLMVACVWLQDLHAHMRAADGSPNMLAGSSVYPIVENLCLALRAQGVGSIITTLICEREAEAAAILDLPAGVVSACHVAVGYPEGGFPTRLTRLPVDQLICRDRYTLAAPGGASR
jgi:nitroreductase